jgi:hypothetical protein
MGIKKKDLILTIIGIGIVIIITAAITVITLMGAAGAISF